MATQESQGIKLFGQTITLIGSKPTKTEERTIINTEPDPTVVMKRPDKIIPCPRCKSMETKFCYFNNYNVNQPRHFCKGCQRYWTAGGALRNVPVGAGRRKTKPPGYGGDQPTETTVYGPSGAHKTELVESLLAVEEWQVAAATAAIEAHRGYLHGGFQVKRPRCYYSDGQSC